MNMKKTLYSLMLSEEVIREIDLLAHRLGTNRSSLVNRILAEHVQLRTPEQRVSDIFSAIGELLADSRELVPMLTEGSPSMAMRSCLEYKYRPTIRYEVALLPQVRGNDFGELSVIFRTTSQTLLELLTSFFRLMKRIEDGLLGYPIEYSLEDGRFSRSLHFPAKSEPDSRELAEAVSSYVSLFDRLIKGYVAGSLDAESVAAIYSNALSQGKIIV